MIARYEGRPVDRRQRQRMQPVIAGRDLIGNVASFEDGIQDDPRVARRGIRRRDPVQSHVLGPDAHRQGLPLDDACRGRCGELQCASTKQGLSLRDVFHAAFQDVRLSEEGADEAIWRLVVDDKGGVDAFDTPTPHHGDAVGHHQRFFLAVRDKQRADMKLGMDAPELDLHFLAQRGIEVGQGFVEQQKIGTCNQGACQRDALLHASGQLRRKLLLDAGQPHEVEHLGDACPDLGRRKGTDLEAVGDIVEDVQMGKQRPGLEDQSQAPSPWRQRVGSLAAQEHGALVGLDEPGDEIEGSRLAAAGRAEQRQELAAAHFQGQIADDGLALESLGDIFKPEDGVRGRSHGQQLDDTA